MSLEAAGVTAGLPRPDRPYEPNLAIEAEPCCLYGLRWHYSFSKGLAPEETPRVFRRPPAGRFARFRLELGSLLFPGPVVVAPIMPPPKPVWG